jgi:drug/metabolite transporter (DMT)-like permease
VPEVALLDIQYRSRVSPFAGVLSVFDSIIAFSPYLTLLKRVGGGPAAFVGVATPVIALALSTLFEGYRWTWVAALGVILAVAGNWLALRPGRGDAAK